ncbi:MAG: TonB-dependent receptor [Aquabacterium sp.]
MPNNRFPLRPVAFATALALYGLSAQAQTAAPTSEEAATLPTVKVTASADASAAGLTKPFSGGQVARGSRIGILGNQDLMDTPFSVTSYTNQLIKDQEAKSIGDVLLNDASVRPARGFGNFQQAYYIRGFTVFSDDVAYNGLYGLVPRQYMATEFVERVEVFRGANAFLSGAGAGSLGGSGIGGLINVVPKRAPNDPLTQVSFGVESGGMYSVGTDIARRFGPDQATGIRINAAHRDGETGVRDEKQRLDLFSAGLDWHNRDVRLSADVGYQTNDLDQPRPSVTPSVASGIVSAPNARDNFAQPWTYSNSSDVFATVRGEVDINSSVTAWAALGTRQSKEDNSLATPSLKDAQGNTSSYRFDNVRRDDVKTGEAGVRGKLQTGSVQHTLTASASIFDSVEKGAYAYSDYNIGFAGNIYAPTAVTAPAPNFFSSGQFGAPKTAAKIRTSSLALADTMSFVQDTLLLTVGARHQEIKQSSHDNNTGEQTGKAYDESRVMPVAGLVYKASKEVSVYGNYIEGLVKGDTANSSSSGVVLVNQGEVFAPYVSRQKEVGVKYDGGTLGASAAFFRTSKPLGVIKGNVFGVFGSQVNQGLEFTAFGQPVKGLRFIGGLTLLDAKQHHTDNDGNEAIGTPKRQLNVGADWSVPGVSGLAINGLVVNTSKQYADAANQLEVPSWTRVDAGVRYLVGLSGDNVLTLRARVENLFNKSYWASVGGYPGSGYLVLAQPRTLSVSATIDF